jgi:hypothetical protein
MPDKCTPIKHGTGWLHCISHCTSIAGCHSSTDLASWLCAPTPPYGGCWVACVSCWAVYVLVLGALQPLLPAAVARHNHCGSQRMAAD